MRSINLLDNNALNAMRLAIDGMQRYHNQECERYFRRIVESLVGDISNLDLWDIRDIITVEQERRNRRETVKIVSADSSERLKSLSRQELQILRLVAGGNRTEVISSLLHISERTVANHKTNISAKLGIGSVRELIKFSVQHFDYLRTMP